MGKAAKIQRVAELVATSAETLVATGEEGEALPRRERRRPPEGEAGLAAATVQVPQHPDRLAAFRNQPPAAEPAIGKAGKTGGTQERRRLDSNHRTRRMEPGPDKVETAGGAAELGIATAPEPPPGRPDARRRRADEPRRERGAAA